MNNAAVHRIIVETLREFGIPNPKFSVTNTTILVRDGVYEGRRLFCGHVEVVVFACGERIDFYDHDGNLQRSIRVSQSAPRQNVAA